MVDGDVINEDCIEVELGPEEAMTPTCVLWVKGNRPVNAEYAYNDTYVLRFGNEEEKMLKVGCEWTQVLTISRGLSGAYPVKFQLSAGQYAKCDIVMNGYVCCKLKMTTVIREKKVAHLGTKTNKEITDEYIVPL